MNENIKQQMHEIGKQAKASTKTLRLATAERKHAALIAMAENIISDSEKILAANKIDCQQAEQNNLSSAKLDRLRLDKNRITDMANSARTIAELADPIGTTIASWQQPNGLKIERVRTPLGVIGIIYEARPNVTLDASALCLKSGNAAILRGGSDCFHSAQAIYHAIQKSLRQANLPGAAIQLVGTNNRDAVGEMLTGLNGTIDVIVPRGGKSLVERVQQQARVPVFAHLEGLCHIYIDKSAELEMAVAIVVNAKMRRTSVCGAVETLLIDAAAKEKFGKTLVEALLNANCEVRGDEFIQTCNEKVTVASEQDWHTEYLDSIISIKIVDGIAGAISHIENYSSQHTETIVAQDEKVVQQFFQQLDSAILLHNASTQFADGGEFGMGGEIGIATGKMHARGPVGIEQLTSFNYRVFGTGHIR